MLFTFVWNYVYYVISIKHVINYLWKVNCTNKLRKLFLINEKVDIVVNNLFSPKIREKKNISLITRLERHWNNWNNVLNRSFFSFNFHLKFECERKISNEPIKTIRNYSCLCQFGNICSEQNFFLFFHT